MRRVELCPGLSRLEKKIKQLNTVICSLRKIKDSIVELLYRLEFMIMSHVISNKVAF